VVFFQKCKKAYEFGFVGKFMQGVYKRGVNVLLGVFVKLSRRDLALALQAHEAYLAAICYIFDTLLLYCVRHDFYDYGGDTN